MTRKTTPHANTRLARYLDKRILELRPTKSQAQISAEAGFVNASMLAMIKNGTSKLPIDRTPSLAKALDVDPAYLLQLALEQSIGDTAAKAILEVFGVAVSKNEASWVQELRDASDGKDPPMTARSRSSLRAIFGK